ncbi:MAG: HD domain-containing protein [Methylotenera sp.]|nr:HD domain-containing protein [Methylotenera sp.]
MTYVEHLIKSLFVMASMVEAKDPYTGGHLWRVSQYCRILANDSELPLSTVARIAIGGFLHDIGKIAVSDAILNKPGKLTDDEYELIKTHPDVGHRLLSNHPLAELVKSAVLAHHEMPDGNGYPNGLSGAAISLDASIVGICDAFDAMTSTRPYRKGMPKEQALAIIQENLGSQFHADWGYRFIQLGNAGVLDEIIGHSEPGIPLQECPICGPTIVITKNNLHGDHVYCRSCGSEALVNKQAWQLSITPTGRKGSAKNLEPLVDNQLLNELVLESSKHVVISEYMDEKYHILS